MNIQTSNLAIISPLKPTYSETFIKAHIDLLPANTHLFYSLPKRGYHPIFDPEGNSLFSRFKWIHFLETGLERIFNPEIGYYFRKRQLRKQLKEKKIDVVMTEYGPTGTMVMNDCKTLNIPLVVHFHGRDAYHYETIEKYGSRYKQMFKIASKIIAVSTEMKDQLISLGANPAKINVTPCGPNHDFDINVDLSANPFQFITSGRFVGKKAPQLVIKAFNELLKSETNCKLIMLADGPLWEECKKLSKEFGIDDKIEFMGPQNKQKIIELFQGSYAFVQHSVRAKDGDSEGTPVSILEAMLAGLPIISTRHAGIKDVVLENETGLLVDEGDWKGMARNMVQLVKDRNMAIDLGRKGKKRVKDNFTLQHHLDKVWSTIESSHS